MRYKLLGKSGIQVSKEVVSPQILLNRVRQQPGTIIPVIGTRKISQLQNDLSCLEFDLENKQLQRLNDVRDLMSCGRHDPD